MKTDSEIIDELGGNKIVAQLCQPTMPEVVSGWRKRGIPRAWRALLMKAHPEVFDSENHQQVA